MDFPRLVFKSPGPFYCNGGTYGHVPVKDDAEFRAACAAGYHPTVPEALKHAGEKLKEAPAEKPEAKPEIIPQVHIDREKDAEAKGLKPVVPEPRTKGKK